MSGVTKGLIGAALLACGALRAQSTAPRATPQTQQSAPASTGAAAVGSQQAESNAAHSAAKGGSRGTTGHVGGGRPGITGVPAYHAGYRAKRGTPVPKGNSQVTVIGGTKAATVTDARLPGVPAMHNPLGISAGTPIEVRLLQEIDSGAAKNGDRVRGVLSAPVAQVPAGSPVELTVVASAAAGSISSGGELSLQVISINGEPILSEVITAEGKEGAKILPDDAPGRGTEAVFAAGQNITVPAAS